MGRTLPTIIQTIETEKDTWNHFRRTLRKEDQDAYDSLWRFSRRHAAPISMASRPVTLDSVFMAMLVGIQRQLMDLERRMETMGGKPVQANENTEINGMDI